MKRILEIEGKQNVVWVVIVVWQNKQQIARMTRIFFDNELKRILRIDLENIKFFSPVVFAKKMTRMNGIVRICGVVNHF